MNRRDFMTRGLGVVSFAAVGSSLEASGGEAVAAAQSPSLTSAAEPFTVYRPAVGRLPDGRLEVFAKSRRSLRDFKLWHRWQTAPNGSWSCWEEFGDDFAIERAPVVGQNSDGRLEVFAVKNDNSLYHRWQLPGGGWSAWTSLGGQTFGTPSVAANADGHLELFVLGTDKYVWHRWQVSPSGTWNAAWEQLGGTRLVSNRLDQSDIAVGRNADGRIELFGLGEDRRIYHTWQVRPNDTWIGSWYPLDGFANGDPERMPEVATNADGRLEVFVVDRNGEPWHNWQNPHDGAWSGWYSLGGRLASAIGVGRGAGGRLELFAESAELIYVPGGPAGPSLQHSVVHRYQILPGSWNDQWLPFAGSSASKPTVANNVDGRLEIFTAGTNESAPQHKWEMPGGGWNVWHDFDQRC
ncbi:hypothetical protein ACIPW5_16935 [Streptomyces sp. NPDC090077]|uniref:hypothetical protein n=1 Tax=Streptomyces sp. NPDC090077 TaxID=3365938 RepID=UPI00380A6AE2